MDQDKKDTPKEAPAAPAPAEQKPAPEKDETPVRYNDWASI